MRTVPRDHTLEAYYLIAFKVEGEESLPRTMFVYLTSFSEDEPPKIHANTFINIFDNIPGKFAKNPDSPAITARTIVGISSLCFEADVPNNENK